jgi:hypothetical protein
MKTAIALSILATGALPAGSMGAGDRSGTVVSAISGGVRVTVSVPGRVYRHNALVQVTVQVENTTPLLIFLDAGCGREDPKVEVTSRSGNEIDPYFLAPLPLVSEGCFTKAGVQISPHHRLIARSYVVLGGPGIRAVLTLRTGEIIATKPAMVTLVRGQTPAVTVSAQGGVHAIVPRPSGAKGALLSRGWSTCLEHGLPFSEIDSVWKKAIGDVAFPQSRTSGCSVITRWHAFVGYANWPVATVNYNG